MQKHPFFDLQVIENDEIADILAIDITTRETLTQWPLSSVEKIVCSDGSKWIVKSNHQPCDIEGHFYAKVTSPHVIEPAHIQSTSPYQTIIYPYFEASPFPIVNLNKKREIEQYFRNEFLPMLNSINQLELPVYLKIDEKEDFLTTFRTMISRLRRLVEEEKYISVTEEDLQTLSKLIESPLTLEIGLSDTGFVHGDFTIDNILFDKASDQLKILDWQRPIYGSSLIDEYSFVKSRGFDPDPPAVLIGTLVQINWLSDCALNWFPAGCNTYNRQTKEHLIELWDAFQAIKTNQIKM